jgi:pre-mRNA-splicing factor ATP-dependent RNA helicase DHX15/PRP43
VDWCFKNFLNHRHLKSAFDIREQLKTIILKFIDGFKDEIPLKINPVPIKKCILSGYFTQVAVLQKNNVYLTVKDSQVVIIHPSSILTYRPEYVVYN